MDIQQNAARDIADTSASITDMISGIRRLIAKHRGPTAKRMEDYLERLLAWSDDWELFHSRNDFANADANYVRRLAALQRRCKVILAEWTKVEQRCNLK